MPRKAVEVGQIWEVSNPSPREETMRGARILIVDSLEPMGIPMVAGVMSRKLDPELDPDDCGIMQEARACGKGYGDYVQLEGVFPVQLLHNTCSLLGTKDDGFAPNPNLDSTKAKAILANRRASNDRNLGPLDDDTSSKPESQN